MALTNNKRQRTLTLCALFLAQGIPRGFMIVAMVSYLTERGISDVEAGRISAIILLPWAFKLVWAPLIDSVAFRAMGRRRPWIIGAELMMALSLLGLLAIRNITHDLTLLSWMFFVHNCFASFQDVSTDALAIDILPLEELGRANGLMWGSKLLGKGLGAAGLASVMNQWGLKSAVVIQFVLLISIMLFPLLIVERPGERRFPWSTGSTPDPATTAPVLNVLTVLQDLRRAFWLRTTSVFLLFGLLTSISEEIVEVITKPFYTQVLGWTFVRYSSVNGASTVAQVLGAVLGGWMADRFGRRTAMTLGLGVYGLLAIAFGTFTQYWTRPWFTVGYLLLGPAATAFGSVAFLSMSMRVSWTRSAVTVFTSIITICSLGHVIGDWLIGPLREGLGLSYEQVFWVAGALMVGPLPLLLGVTTKQIDAMKVIETSAISS